MKLPECTKAPDNVNPTVEWQQSQVADFSKVRMYISQIRDEITEGKRPRGKSDIKLVLEFCLQGSKFL